MHSNVRYVSCLFWVISASRTKGQPADGSSSEEPTIHSLLKTTNTPVFDFFLQTSQLGKLAGSLSLLQKMLSADEAARIHKIFTSVEVHFIIRVMLFTKIKKVIEEVVSDAQRREGVHKGTWLLFLNVQHEHKAFDMFPGFCICVASLHAVLSSHHGFDPCSVGEAAAGGLSAREEWSRALLDKACAEKSVAAEVLRVAPKVAEEWRDVCDKASSGAAAAAGKSKEGGSGSGGGAMAAEELERCSELSARLSCRLSQVALA